MENGTESEGVMYITRITYKNKETKDFLFNTEQEAKEFLLSFKNDQSGSFRNVAVLDNRNYVLHILVFLEENSTEMISAGNCVKLQDKYCSPEEKKRNDIYVVTNINEWSERINITCLTSNLVLKSSETVGAEMVKVLSPANI